MKKIIVALLIFGLIGGVVIYKIYNKPHQNIEDASSVLKVDATKLLADYQASEVSANERYLGKIITVSGTIEELNVHADRKQVILATGDMMSRISCDLDHLTKHGQWQSLKKGDAVKLKGKCSGFSMEVVLSRCVIL